MSSIASELPTKRPTQVIDDIYRQLRQEPRSKGPTYTLVLGAGLSHPIVPLTRKLLYVDIGHFYFPDQDQSSIPREEEEKAARGFLERIQCSGRILIREACGRTRR